MRASLRILTALVLSPLASSFTLAQVVGSTLNGVVTDAVGAPIAGAAVQVRSEETGTERRLLTDSAGR
ncbi:MAG: carboxypeptidase-like regulatory domain-containing protein, partial [Janthinobacterium lividum]